MTAHRSHLPENKRQSPYNACINQGSAEKQNQQILHTHTHTHTHTHIYIYTYIHSLHLYLKELAFVIMEAEKFHNLPSKAGDPGKVVA